MDATDFCGNVYGELEQRKSACSGGSGPLGTVNGDFIIDLGKEKKDLKSLQAEVSSNGGGVNAEGKVAGQMGILHPAVLVAEVEAGFFVLNQNFHVGYKLGGRVDFGYSGHH
jgi:hypothetical protein